MSLSKYTVIHCAKQLQAGDHISWNTEQISGIPNHHAIVVAHKSDNQFKVIHVNDVIDGYSTASGFPLSSYSAIEEIIDFSQQMNMGTLCCYDYEPRKCNEPVEVIQNGRSKLGKFDYDALKNNSEHFARWCKSGNNRTITAFLIKSLVIIIVIIIILSMAP